MLRNLAFTFGAVAAWVLGASRARATPAEIVVVLDTSASMNEPSGGPDGETKLDVARDVVTRLVQAAADARHRTGLLRFRQIDAIVEGGEGPLLVHEEDEEQCRRVADLLVPVGPGSASEIAAWTDGNEDAANPEVVALGDSPLFGAVRVAIRYIRGRRSAAPLTSCVNAFVVVITDGRDTCAAGAELENALTELREQSVTEDIRGLVLSFDPESESAALLSRLGHPDDEEASPYGPADADAFVRAVAQIEGRLAPEACVESGVAPEVVGLAPEGGPGGGPGGPGGGEDASDGSGGGCAALGGSPRPLGGLLLIGMAALLAARRRRILRPSTTSRLLRATIGAIAVLATLCACGDDDGSGRPAPDGGSSMDVGSDPGATLTDPSEGAATALARLDAILGAASRVRRDHLAPMLVPELAFAAVDGEAGCTSLVRSMAYEPYSGAQRGVEGCLATRQCNALDLSLVLEACLESKGTEAEIQRCVPSATFRSTLLGEATRRPEYPDLSAVDDALREATEEAMAAEPGLLDDLRALRSRIHEYIDLEIVDRVAQDVELLTPHVPVTATSAGIFARSFGDAGARRHYFVTVDGRAIDPVLAGSDAEAGRCNTPSAVDLAAEATTVRMQLLVRYADVDPRNLTFGTPVVAAEATWTAHESWGRYATLAIVDAATREVPDGVPPAAESGCLRGLIATPEGTEVGTPFFLEGADATDCPGTPAVEVGPGRHLAAITLRTEVTYESQTSSLDRVLVDRYGYAFGADGAHESGPQFSGEAARLLAPMRVDLLVAGGPIGPHRYMDAVLEDYVARRNHFAGRLAAEHGEPIEEDASADDATPPFAWGTLGAYAHYSPRMLPEGAWRVAARPARLAVVRRRGYVARGEGLGIGVQTIFDIVDHPVLVVAPEEQDDERLRANVALGALLTEAERVVAMGIERASSAVNAGAMLRDPDTGPWAEYGSDDTHAVPDFSLSVREAHRNRMLNGEVLIVTPGAAPFGGGEYVAWWRIDSRSGHALGEIRYDGTFYGGVAVVEAIARYDGCLFAASVLALQDGRRIADQQCCFDLATEDLVQNLVMDHVMAVLGTYVDDVADDVLDGWGPLGGALGSTYRSVRNAGETIDGVMDAQELYDALTAPPPCTIGE